MTQTTEDLKKKKQEQQRVLREVFARAAIGDYSQDVPLPDDGDDADQEFSIGLQIMLNVIREKIKRLESEVEISKKREKLLSEEKAKQEALILSIADGLIVVDREGKVTFINDSACQLVEYDKNEAIGKIWGKDFPKVFSKDGSVVPYENTSTYDALKKGKTNVLTYYYMKKSNVKVSVSVSSAPIVMNGNIQGAVSVVRDITRETELEKMKGEFISMASHELRTPLTGIRGALSMIFEGRFGPVPENIKETLSDIFKAADRLQNMTNDILSISRMETGEMKFDAEPVQLKSILDEVVTEVQPLLVKKNISFSSDVDENLYILADPMKLRQICTNLIGNALKFTDKGSISVSASVNGYYIDILFKDTGIGIEEADKSKLFQKFTQFSSGSTRPAGSGLGLYISKEFAKKMGGDLTLVESTQGSGSTFLLSLPSVN